MDVTQNVLRYRKCVRHVWNAYFQPMQDGRVLGPPEHQLRGADVIIEFENVRLEGLT